jgi:hypothetical protein
MAYPDDEFGAAIRGAQPTVPPMQSIMAPAQPPSGGFLSDPRDRAALLQIGLNLMQPPAWGSGTGGHIAQSIGAGGEAVSRREKEDIAAQSADAKLAIADERLRIAQQNADTRERKGLGSAIKGISAGLQYRQERDELKDKATAQKDVDAKLEKDVTDAYDASRDILNRDSPEAKKYGQMTRSQIREALRGGGTTAPAAAGKYGPPGTVLRQGGKTYVVGPDGNPVEK